MPPTANDEIFRKVQLDAFNRLLWPQRQRSNLYLDHRLLQAGQTVGRDVALDRPTIVVFADDEPWATTPPDPSIRKSTRNSLRFLNK